MSEKTVIRPSQCVFLPDDLDDVTAAAIANPGMSAWAALKERAKLMPGETVLVNGATGTAGRLAIQVAKYMSAKKVVATGRNTEALKAVAGLGADVIMLITPETDIPPGTRSRRICCLGLSLVSGNSNRPTVHDLRQRIHAI